MLEEKKEHLWPLLKASTSTNKMFIFTLVTLQFLKDILRLLKLVYNNSNEHGSEVVIIKVYVCIYLDVACRIFPHLIFRNILNKTPFNPPPPFQIHQKNIKLKCN